MHRKFWIVTLVAALSLSPAFAQEPVTGRIRWDAPESTPRPRSGLWKLSVLFAAAAATADSHSSWGRLEINPALRSANGRFGLQGVAIKALITGGAIGAQYLLLRRNPKAEKYGVVTNMVMAGVLGTAAVANYRMAARERREDKARTVPVP
jgi:hypothetical protein